MSDASTDFTDTQIQWLKLIAASVYGYRLGSDVSSELHAQLQALADEGWLDFDPDDGVYTATPNLRNVIDGLEVLHAIKKSDDPDDGPSTVDGYPGRAGTGYQ